MLAKYTITDGFSVVLGPQVGFLASSKAKAPIIEIREEAKLTKKIARVSEANLEDQFKSTDFGFNFGAGYQLKNGVGIHARYYLGLANIFEYSTPPIPGDKNPNTKALAEGDDFKLKNRVFSITISYAF